MKKIFLITLLFFSPLLPVPMSSGWRGVGGEVYAQQAKLDSLIKANNEYTKQDEKKIQLLNGLADVYQWMQLDSGINYADLAIALAIKLNNQKELAVAYNNKAMLLFSMGRHEEEEQV